MGDDRRGEGGRARDEARRMGWDGSGRWGEGRGEGV